MDEEDIFSFGHPVPNFSTLFAVVDSEDETSFYVKSESERDLTIHPPIIHADSNLMRPVIVDPAEVILSGKETYEFRVRYRCLTAGFGNVQITLASPDFQHYEIKYKKACKKPVVVMNNSAGQMLTIMQILVFGGLVWCCAFLIKILKYFASPFKNAHQYQIDFRREVRSGSRGIRNSETSQGKNSKSLGT